MRQCSVVFTKAWVVTSASGDYRSVAGMKAHDCTAQKISQFFILQPSLTGLLVMPWGAPESKHNVWQLQPAVLSSVLSSGLHRATINPGSAHPTVIPRNVWLPYFFRVFCDSVLSFDMCTWDTEYNAFLLQHQLRKCLSPLSSATSG